MPIDRSRYPADWKAIAREIKNEAGWKCEQCDRPCRRPGQNWFEFALSLPANWFAEIGEGKSEKKQRFTLTVAHLDHQPQNCDRSNLRALCAPCHLRYDAKHHAINAAATRARKRDQQFNLFEAEKS